MRERMRYGNPAPLLSLGFAKLLPWVNIYSRMRGHVIVEKKNPRTVTALQC